jgi:hypothetical protein
MPLRSAAHIVLEGSVLEGSVLEGSVLEGSVLEGSVLEGSEPALRERVRRLPVTVIQMQLRKFSCRCRTVEDSSPETSYCRCPQSYENQTVRSGHAQC